MFQIVNRFIQFLISSKPNDILLKTFFVLLLLYFIVSKHDSYEKKEGFTQKQPFLLKRNENAYDDFYSPIYEHLYHVPQRTQHEVENILQSTLPDKNRSVFLDVGCGTGMLVSKILKEGYSCFGLDKSKSMVQYSLSKYPNAPIKCGDALNPMEFEPKTFTHILCMNQTIYHFSDKKLFFKNCARWLTPHGYLVLHLVEPSKFSAITPAGYPSLLDDPQKYSKDRITATSIDFHHFKYKSVYNFDHLKNGVVTLTETFTDGNTGHIRQNEYDLFMEDHNIILDLAAKYGFVQKGHFQSYSRINDKYQNVYILEYTGIL